VSLTLIGDSTTNQLFRTMGCVLESSGFKKYISKREYGDDVLSGSSGIEKRSTSSSSSCLMFTRETDLFELCLRYEAKFPVDADGYVSRLLDSSEPHSIFLAGISSHYNDNEEYEQDLRNFAQAWMRLATDTNSPTLILRQPLPQHFLTNDGHYDANAHTKECSAHNKADPKYSIFTQTVSPLNIATLDVYNWTSTAVIAHPNASIKVDCTHYCNAVVYQWTALIGDALKGIIA